MGTVIIFIQGLICRALMLSGILYSPSYFSHPSRLPQKRVLQTRLVLCGHQAMHTVLHRKDLSIGQMWTNPMHPVGRNMVNLKRYDFFEYKSLKVQGNIILATYMAHHFANDGILTFSLHPGSIRSEILRSQGGFAQWLINTLFMYPTPLGAITQLYVGTSPKLTKTDNGKYFIPWAREAAPAKGIQDPALADRLWGFLEKDTAGKY